MHPVLRYAAIVLIAAAVAAVFSAIYWLFDTYLRGLF